MKPKIKITYSTWTPEDCEIGETDDKGWIDEEGVEIEADEDITLVEAAVDYLTDEGVSQCSCSSGYKGSWYTNPNYDEDFQTGGITEQCYHLYDFTEDQEYKIYETLKSQGVI